MCYNQPATWLPRLIADCRLQIAEGTADWVVVFPGPQHPIQQELLVNAGLSDLFGSQGVPQSVGDTQWLAAAVSCFPDSWVSDRYSCK